MKTGKARSLLDNKVLAIAFAIVVGVGGVFGIAILLALNTLFVIPPLLLLVTCIVLVVRAIPHMRDKPSQRNKRQ